MTDGEYTKAGIGAMADWMLSPEGQAAARAAMGFAQRTGLSVTGSEVCAIVLTAHEGEVAARGLNPRPDQEGS